MISVNKYLKLGGMWPSVSFSVHRMPVSGSDPTTVDDLYLYKRSYHGSVDVIRVPPNVCSPGPTLFPCLKPDLRRDRNITI